MNGFPIPLVGFCAYSGTGKTTLLRKLIPALKSTGLRIGVVKHAHHAFDIDHPGKDSYELRHAGAEQMLIASSKRIAFIKERSKSGDEPQLEEALACLDAGELDLVLVEGFKKEPFPKIELHRPELGKPLMFPNDGNIIAIAVDAPLPTDEVHIPCLDINDVDGIAGFICDEVLHDPELKRGFTGKVNQA